MKLQCSVERCDRLMPSVSISAKRPQMSFLCIGQASVGKDACILHQTPNNKIGTMYKIKGNIMKVFTKFIKDGKATISFQSPPHDLMIKTKDSLQLKSFLSIIQSVLQGKQLSRGGGGLSTLCPGDKMPKAPKTKLSIKSKADYPVLEGFPRTLLHLEITGIEQSRFDERVLKLQNLRKLDLTSNRLKVIPAGLSALPNLSELILKDNKLGDSSNQLRAWDWMRGKVIKSLRLLDLCHNNISVLPSFLRDLTSLVTLKVDHNQLKVLPSGLGRMKALRYLSVSNNQLQFLPGSMISMHLDVLDVSLNPFHGHCTTTESIQFAVLSLKELSAREVIGHNIPVSEAIIPATVLYFMLGCDFCICGSACFNPAVSKVVQYDTRKLTSSITLVANESSSKPMRLSVCSEKCYHSKFACLVRS